MSLLSIVLNTGSTCMFVYYSSLLGCPLYGANEGISENALKWLLMKKPTCKHPLVSEHAIGPHLLRSLEASRRLTEKYDFVVTSGGIGPTHDGQCATRLGGQSDIIH